MNIKIQFSYIEYIDCVNRSFLLFHKQLRDQRVAPIFTVFYFIFEKKLFWII